jgi:hypothetical protein
MYLRNLFNTGFDALQYSSNDGNVETKESFFKYDSNKLKKDLNIPDEKEVVSKDIYDYFEKNNIQLSLKMICNSSVKGACKIM